MRQRIIITTLAFMAGLFVASQGLGAGEHGSEMDSKGYGAMMDESRQPGVAAHGLDSCQISRIQNILKDKGFDAGPSDGILGPKTSQALRRFQGSEGLAVTGKPDTETLRTLTPDTGMQEYFGISPEFDEKEMVEEQPRRRGEDYGEIERMFDY